MLEQLIGLWAQRPYQQILSADDWFRLQAQYAADSNPLLVKLIAEHSGISQAIIQSAIVNGVLPEEFEDQQIEATKKIDRFLERPYFKRVPFQALGISRIQWLHIIALFEKCSVKVMNDVFFVSVISQLQKRPFDEVRDALKSRASLPRGAKRPRDEKSDEGHRDNARAHKRSPSFFSSAASPNPLILDADAADYSSPVRKSGTRIARLGPAQPTPSHPNVKSTPNGTRVQPLGRISGLEFYAKVSPSRPTRCEGPELPSKLKQVMQATPVSFIATLDQIESRAGLGGRVSQRSIMGVSASTIFNGHGFEIKSEQSHHYHWAHMIAHFLADESDITSENSYGGSINLVASTAAANYNTLELVELYIKRKLESGVTKSIAIQVTPRFIGSELIPQELEYDLTWEETNSQGVRKHQEKYLIKPKSSMRYNASMKEMLQALRDDAHDADPTAPGSKL